jgi:hypothetical protein
MVTTAKDETEPWQNSAAQRILSEYLESGAIADDMKPKQVYDEFCLQHEEFVGFVYKNFGRRLRAMRQQRVDHGGETRPWHNSAAQRLLCRSLESCEIPNDMGPKAVWDGFCAPHSEFDGVLYPKFSGRLRYMRNQLFDQDDRAAAEMAAMERDRILCPILAFNHRSEPRWEGSEAERFLKIDVTAERNQTMTPRELHATREAYLQHSLATFRSHIYQEVGKRKFVDQYYSGARDNSHN